MHQITLNTPSGGSTISVGRKLSENLLGLESKPIILIDENVLCEHSETFCCHTSLVIPSGERYKTLETVEKLYRDLVKIGADRSSLLVGVGGGLATDVAGYVASTYLREVSFGFISSSLLGQVDASIGGKNGVNLDGYKNMIGTIRQPSFVWCDLDLLHTLSRKEYISGIAEVIKYGAIMDFEFLGYLKEHMKELLALDPTVLEEVVTRSVKAKVEVVEKDEKEAGLRKLLNFGHTLGHAIERNQKLLHGQAVAVGMVMASRLSSNLGMLSRADADLIEEIIASAGLPVEVALNPEEIYANILKDKKKSGDLIHFILLDGPGNAVVKPIPLKELKPMLNDLY